MVFKGFGTPGRSLDAPGAESMRVMAYVRVMGGLVGDREVLVELETVSSDSRSERSEVAPQRCH